MNYPQAEEIKQILKDSQKILLCCHSRPDADSVGSAQAMRRLMMSWNKEVEVVCADKIPNTLKFLEEYGGIKEVSFRNFDFDKWDVVVCLDSSSWQRVAADSTVARPQIKMIVIDHHKTNTFFGDVNLVDPDIGANCQLLFNLFNQWQENINLQPIATSLLAGIIGDTGAFRFPEADENTLKTALSLMKSTDKNKIITNLYQTYDLNSVKLWGEILGRMQLNIENNYVWSAIEKEVFVKYGSPIGSKSEIADMLFQSIKDTDFGMVIVEETVGYVSVSLRSRTGFDVSEIAERLDGGGHRWAAAGKVTDLSFNQALEKIHEVTADVCKNQKRS